MFKHTHALSLAAALLVAACADHPTQPKDMRTTSPSLSRGEGSGAARNADKRAELLTDMPVTGTLASGGTFSGTLTATKITIDEATRQLTLTGVLNGTALKSSGEVVDVVNQSVTAPLTINRPGAVSSLIQPAAQASCGILHLDLGPLNLNLLGLVVDLNEVILNLTAVTGAGNLLGNLLCALTGLLDIPGAIAAITHILDTINNILSGLTVPGVGGVMWVAPHAAFQSWSV
jgi:hypothetical protein